MNLKIPYGKGHLKFSMPSERLLGVLQNKHIAARSAHRLLSDALKEKSAVSRLKNAVAGKKSLLIVVPDSTRHAHLKAVIPELIRRIRAYNRSIKISLIVATGLHKKLNKGQLLELLGPVIVKSCKIISHELGIRSLVKLGRTKNDVPIMLNKALRDYGAVISVGVIEPHLYAGYSGGAKTVAIGLAGEETINATHSVRFLDYPHTRIGSTKRNPFQDALWQILSKTNVAFSVNIVNDPEGRPLKIFAGDTKALFVEGARFAQGVFQVEAKVAADIAICGVGYPKDVNLYQASRAINYVLNVDRPVVKKCGAVIVVAELKDGIGKGAGEKRFYAQMENMTSPEDFVNKIRKAGCIAGVHRAYMVAKTMVDHRIIFVSRDPRGYLSALPFPTFNDIEAAIRYVDSELGRQSKIYVIPRALATIARLSP